MADRAIRLVVLLHGHGDDPERLSRWAGEAAALSGASEVLVPTGGSSTGDGPSWLESDDAEPDDVAGALDALETLIDQQCTKLGIDRRAVIVGGFSQGGAVALALALRAGRGVPYGGCFVLCGFLWPPSSVDYDFGRAANATPMLIVHGADDQSVPVQQGRSAARLLDRKGVTVSYHEYAELGHELHPAYLDDLKPWMVAVGHGVHPVAPPT